MAQTAFLLEKMFWGLPKWLLVRRFAKQSFTIALQACVGPSGPWTFQGSIPKNRCINPDAFMLPGPAGPWALQGPIPKQRPRVVA